MDRQLKWSCFDYNEPRLYVFEKDVHSDEKKPYQRNMKRLARKFRKRERKEFECQLKQENYLQDLQDVEPEIDEYLEKGTQEAPTEHMIAYAKHSWPYNEMSPKKRYRLSKIRIIVEEYLQTSSDNWLKTNFGRKVPICAICRSDLENDNNNSPLKLRCGHIFHLKCLVEYYCRIERYDSCPVCRKSARLVDVDPVFFSYSD